MKQYCSFPVLSDGAYVIKFLLEDGIKSNSIDLLVLMKVLNFTLCMVECIISWALLLKAILKIKFFPSSCICTQIHRKPNNNNQCSKYYHQINLVISTVIQHSDQCSPVDKQQPALTNHHK
jgi:hypothetical protein